MQHLGKKLKSILTFSDLSLASRESLSVLRLVSPSLEPCLSVSTLLSLLGLSVSHSILSSIRFSLQSLGSLTLLDRRSSLVPPLTLASESSPSEEPSPAPAQALVSQLESHSPGSKNIRLFLSVIVFMIVKLYGVYKKKKSTSAQSSQEAETDALPVGYGGFYAFFTQQAGTGKSALDVYLSEPVLDMLANTKLDVIKYWKGNSSRFKELSQMACDVLCIPITTVSSESSFSVGNRVLSKYRSRLLPSNVEALICARN
uniref:HAT C-terminal dimerisation domain-containing protein n=1 Tax=Brassica oleracea var. oleracea TaxID=109376 RepID=A0A0D3AE35_BRAOL